MRVVGCINVNPMLGLYSKGGIKVGKNLFTNLIRWTTDIAVLME